MADRLSRPAPGPIAAQPVRRRKRRWARRLALAFGALVVLLALLVFAVPSVVPESVVGRIVAAQIRDSVKRGASVQGARFTVFSGFRARGITIERREGYGEGHLATVGKLAVDLDYRALLGGTVRLANLRIEGLDVHLIRDRRGVLNIQDLLDQPKSKTRVLYGRIVAKSIQAHLTDLRRGLNETIQIAQATVSEVSGNQRTLAVQASVGSGGQVTLDGDVSVTPRTEQFERGRVDLVVRSLALGRMATTALHDRLREARVDPASLTPTVLDATLKLTASAARAFTAQGTVTLREVPPVPQLALEGPQRAVKLSLDADLSPDKQRIDLAVETEPHRALGLSLKADNRFHDSAKPGILLEDFFVDALVKARGDLARGGLPGTPLTAGNATVNAALKGGLQKLDGTLTTSLQGGRIKRPNGAERELPPATLDAVATVSLGERGLTAVLDRLSAATAGLAAGASGRVRLLPSGPGEWRTQQIVLSGKSSAEVDFGQLPQALVDLLQLPVDGRLAGTLKAGAELGEAAMTIQRSGTGKKPTVGIGPVQLKGGLTLTQFAVTGGARPVPPSDLTAKFDLAADLSKSVATFQNTTVRGSGIDGKLDGSVSLGEATAPATLEGQLDVDLAEVTRRYGVLVGISPDLAVSGTVAWRLKAQKTGEELVARGRAAVTDLTVGGKAWKGEPLREAKTELVHDLSFDRQKGRLVVRSFRLQSQRANADAKGILVLPGKEGASDITLSASVDASTLGLVRALLPKPLRSVEARGTVAARVSATGTSQALKGEGTLRWPGARVDAAGVAVGANLDYTFGYDYAAPADGRLASGALVLRGGASLTKLSLDASKHRIEPFAEPEATVNHDLRWDGRRGLLAVKSLAVALKQAKAQATVKDATVALPLAEGQSKLTVVATADTALARLARRLLPKSLADLELTGQATAQVAVAGTPTKLTASGSVNWPGARARAADSSVAADLAYTFHARRDGDQLDLRGQGRLANFVGASRRLGHKTLDEALLTVDHDVSARIDGERPSKSRFQIRRLSVQGKLLDVRCTGTADEKLLRLALKGRASTDLLALVPEPPKELQASGPADFDLQVAGSLTAPRITGTVDAARTTVSHSDLLRKPAGLPASATLDVALDTERRLLDVRRLEVRLGAAQASLTLRAPLDFGRVEATVRTPKGGLDLASLAELSPRFKALGPSGTLSADIAGTLLGLGEPVARAGVAPPQAKQPVRFEKLSGRVELVAKAEEVDVDALVARFGGPPAAPPPPGQPAAAPAGFVIPELPPELEGKLTVRLAKVVYDKRTFEGVEVDGTLAKSILSLTKLAARSGGGTVGATARLAFGGDRHHWVKATVDRVPLDQEFELLGEIPLLKVAWAMLGGRPQRMSFQTTAQAEIHALGADQNMVTKTTSGKGTVVLTNLRVVGSRMFQLIATLARHPELGDITFERVDAPFIIANGIVRNTATFPYQGGSFFVQGTANLAGPVDYRASVRNPRGMRFIGSTLARYLDGDRPVVRITGTLDQPRAELVVQPIQFGIEQLLRRQLERRRKD